MPLGDPINIRLNIEKQAIFEDEAARQGKKLATYLRERLESDDAARVELEALRHELGAGLAAIRHAIEDNRKRGAAAPAGTAAPGQIDTGLLLEMVLLLRTIGGPEKMKVAQSELKRQGFNSWTPHKE